MNAEDLIDEILEAEGGYVDDDADRGGCTNHGITRETLSKWRGREVDCDEVRELTRDEARDIYRKRYIRDPGFDQVLDADLRALLVDSGVQHGPQQAIEWLQEAAGTTVDGIIGPNTLAEVREADPRELYLQVLSRRIRYYGAIISNDHSQARFALGWMRRVTQFVEEA